MSEPRRTGAARDMKLATTMSEPRWAATIRKRKPGQERLSGKRQKQGNREIANLLSAQYG